MKNAFLSSIAAVLALFVSISGICGGGFFEKANAFSSELENIVQDVSHSHTEDKGPSGDEHCADDNGTNDRVVFQTMSSFQSQISSSLGALFSIQVGVESSVYEPLYKTDRTFLTKNSLQRHIRSVVMRF